MLRGNAEIVKTAASEFGPSLRLASDELKCNYDFVMAAVSQHGQALQDLEEPKVHPPKGHWEEIQIQIKHEVSGKKMK